jgi:hypothetical protein
MPCFITEHLVYQRNQQIPKSVPFILTPEDKEEEKDKKTVNFQNKSNTKQ